MKWLLPPVLWALCLIGMAIQWRWFAVHPVVPYRYHVAGLIFVALGFGIALFASYQFRRRGTNILPFRDPGSLITDGIYAYTRNPMYLGMATSLLGFAILLNDLGALVFVLLFVLVANAWYIPFEERAAQRRFGADYEAYRGRVRRWL